MLPIAAFATARGVLKSWWKAGLGVAIGAALALPVGRCQGVDVEKARQREREKAAAELQAARNDAAAQAAAAERTIDAATVTAQEKGRNDAISAAPAGRAAPSSVALACQRLRQQGTRPEALPAACRSGGAH